ncbi:C2H2-type zinc finger protein [Haloprofundus salinisoli]|nr:C2H2-type zinc finger protein [Haloprofundus salinisoli]
MTESDDADSANEVESGSYVCETCGEEFENRAALDAHVRDAGLVD